MIKSNILTTTPIGTSFRLVIYRAIICSESQPWSFLGARNNEPRLAGYEVPRIGINSQWRYFQNFAVCEPSTFYQYWLSITVRSKHFTLIKVITKSNGCSVRQAQLLSVAEWHHWYARYFSSIYSAIILTILFGIFDFSNV